MTGAILGRAVKQLSILFGRFNLQLEFIPPHVDTSEAIVVASTTVDTSSAIDIIFKFQYVANLIKIIQTPKKIPENF